ncbi:MAG TPA: hypothetical protein VKS80_10605 [Trinickia sp.]|nr:hypothetical protein [Trinickia sp.]
MDPISTLNQAMAVLRQQLAERARRGERAPVAGGKAVRDGQAARLSSASGGVSELMRERIAALRAAGVDDEVQLSRAAVELLLRHEFGSRLTNDAEFQQMVSWVHRGLAEDEEGVLRAVVGEIAAL